MYYGTGTPVVQDPEQELAILLNTMVMVQGGNNILLSIPAFNADQTQGCIVLATNIPLVVEALVLIVAGLLIGMVIFLVSYAVRLWLKDRVMKEATKDLPDTVVAWATLAAKEHQISKDQNFAGRVSQRELMSWVVGLEEVRGERKLRVIPKDAITDELPLLNEINGSAHEYFA
jgi:hypothetical protein